MSEASKAYVFGSGPAGLVAAHALRFKGYEVEIATNQFSPSHITGAQYLDKALPGLTEYTPDGLVTFYKVGKGRNYAKKIYGDARSPTSWDKYEAQESYPMWYLRDVYSILWEQWKEKMFKMEVTGDLMGSFVDTDAKLIVSTIPLSAICFNEKHTFEHQEVTIYQGVPTDMPEEHRHLMQQDNWILYNGKKKTPWYRASSINGGKYIETPGHFADGFNINKPLRTTCTCWEGVPRVVLAGRYGTYNKNMLVSSVFDAVLEAHLVVQ